MQRFLFLLALTLAGAQGVPMEFRLGKPGEDCSAVCSKDGGECQVASGWDLFNLAEFNKLIACPSTPGDMAQNGTWFEEVQPAYSTESSECLGYLSIGVTNGHGNQVACGGNGPNLRRVCRCTIPQPGFVVQTYPKPLTTGENGSPVQLVGITLKSRPTSKVTIPISSSNTAEGVTSVTEIVFEPDQWNKAMTFTITGVRDFVEDGNKSYTVSVGPAQADASDPYNGMAVPDTPLDLVNIDVDKVGVTVTPTTGLETNEIGKEATFTIVLDTIPKADVSIPLSSNDTNEGIASPTSVTFTPANWNISQTIIVTGQDDNYDDDGDKTYMIVTAVPISTDTDYSGMVVDDVTVINRNDDIANVVITPECGLVVREDGTVPYPGMDTNTFTVQLTSRPTGPVKFSLSSAEPSEGIPDPNEISWQRDEWDVIRTITLLPQNDDQPDCDQAYEINLSNGESTDPKYNALWETKIVAITQDDDGYCLRVYPICITTYESGTPSSKGVVSVSLSKEPEAGGVVTVPMKSSDTTEGVLPFPEVVFTSANWSSIVEVGVLGVEDYFDDGNINYTVTVGPATTTGDTNYPGVSALLVKGENVDDDTYGVRFDPGAVQITENVDDTPTATIDVYLTSEPLAPVTITIEHQNNSRIVDDTFPTRVAVNVLSMIFQPSEWNISKTITLTAIDNWIDDGDKDYMMVGKDSSSDDHYNTGDMVAYTAVKLVDNETAGVKIEVDGENFPMQFETSEEFQNVTTFTLSLKSEPLAPVNLSFSGMDIRQRPDVFWREVSVEPRFVVVAPDQWNATQTVLVTCNDDMLVDGDNLLQLAIESDSTDPLYSSYRGENWLKTLDNDTVGVIYTLTGPDYTNESGTTTELEFRMITEPMCKWEMPGGTVEVAVASTNPSEGVAEPSMLYISSENWTQPAVITVTGVDDFVADGEQSFNITATIVKTCKNPNAYNGSMVTAEIINGDDDKPGVFLNHTETRTSENMTSLDIVVSLMSQPVEDVYLAVSVNDSTEASIAGTNMLKFTAANWNVTQFITVTGADDDLIDGTVPYEVNVAVTSADPLYGGTMAVVVLENLDNDIPGYVFSVVEAVTSEDGRSQIVNLKLGTKPTSDVTISSITTNDTSEATVKTPVAITFTPDNWGVAQPFTVEGVDDDQQDGDVNYNIIIGAPTTTDPSYSGYTATILGVNIDNDTPGIAIYPEEQLTTTEGGEGAIFTVVLRTQPTAQVSFDVGVSDKTEGALNTTSILFTSGDWSVPQTVSVSGVDDTIFDGDIPYTVTFGDVISSDSAYSSLPTHTINVMNRDNETSPCDEFTGKCLLTAGRCEGCCPSHCSECTKPCSDSATDPCCLTGVTNECSATQHAPCSLEKPCEQYGRVCDNGNCTVCCESWCLDKCAPYDGYCNNMACTGCRPNSCMKVDCSTTHVPQCCSPIDPSTAECSPTVSSPCPIKSPCSAFGDGICKDEECNVCCKASCGTCGGDKCTADPADKECCDTAIAKETKYCSADVGAPCIKNDKCKEWGGICEDEACSVCCPASCGVCGTGGPECTPDTIKKGDKNCGTAGAVAPCIRGTPCTPYGGICKDEDCNVCCDGTCGECGGSTTCSTSPDAKCCDTEVAKTKVYCGPGVNAPCIRNDLCKPYGGICKDSRCTVCCDPMCGECGSLTCNTNPSGLCCTDPIVKSGAMCSETVSAPCIRELPKANCDSIGGICNDRECNVCCDGSCSECGGDKCTANPMDEKCCDTAIAKKQEYCKPTGDQDAPCLRNSLCKEHGGICPNSTCEFCCAASCGECLTMPCTGPCCEGEIVKANTTCGTAPCVRTVPPPYCDVYGGKCADEECKECCAGSCGVCADTAQCSQAGNEQCCPAKVREQKVECSPTVSAPCVRVSECTKHGGICDDVTNCRICCHPSCGQKCGVPETCASLSEVQCCRDNITAAGNNCGEDGATAPCLLPSSSHEDHLWIIILIIVGILLCCSCVAAALFLLRKKDNKGEQDHEKNQNWFTMEEQRQEMHTLLMEKPDEELKEGDPKQDTTKESEADTSLNESGMTATSTSPPKTMKKRGARSLSTSQVSKKAEADVDPGLDV